MECACGMFWDVGMQLFRSGMLDVVHTWNDEVEAFYNDQIINQKRIYSQRFDAASHCCFSRYNFTVLPLALCLSQSSSQIEICLICCWNWQDWSRLVHSLSLSLSLEVIIYGNQVLILWKQNIIPSSYCSHLMIRDSEISTSVNIRGTFSAWQLLQEMGESARHTL